MGVPAAVVRVVAWLRALWVTSTTHPAERVQHVRHLAFWQTQAVVQVLGGGDQALPQPVGRRAALGGAEVRMFAPNILPTRRAPRHGHVVLGDLGLHAGQLGDPGRVRLVRRSIQRRLTGRADVRWFHVDDARDRVTRWSVLESEGPMSGSSTGWLRVCFGRLAAVRCDVAFDLPLEVLNALLQARVLFDDQLDLGRLLAVLLNQEGDLSGLLSVQLEQCLASRLLCHTVSLPNPPPVCHPLHSR